MPKRTCPFPETFSSQYKIHIGQQELNNYGVFGNKYRQEIYEKTKNLLFNGAKAVMGKIWTGEEKCRDPQPPGQAETSACSQTLLRGQTLIGHDGRLTRASASQVDDADVYPSPTTSQLHNDGMTLCIFTNESAAVKVFSVGPIHDP
ncbi:apoptosis regulatory protein Siva isoform X2 [Amphiprion ocellaris]|uniref:apoptosis regulatory protein Siva isoform X2 n=1 Tax=Amphiprion ocellaris TaxID=80972 RepID=UPI001649A33C|nr:apoptosis regulatory protein Siva isoform X2 [Amphiprion ocellaris]